MTDREILQKFRERPEILQLLRAYDAIPEDKKPAAYELIMQKLKEGTC